MSPRVRNLIETADRRTLLRIAWRLDYAEPQRMPTERLRRSLRGRLGK